MHSHFWYPYHDFQKLSVYKHGQIMALVSMLNSKHYSRGMARVAQIFLAIDHNPRGCKTKGDC